MGPGHLDPAHEFVGRAFRPGDPESLHPQHRHLPGRSLVRLESGRLGVVTEQNESSLLTPKVTVFFSLKSNEPISRQVLDLAGRHNHEKIVAVEDKEKWGFKYLDEIWSEV